MTHALTTTPGREVVRPGTPGEVAAAWLLRYSGATRKAYGADLREWGTWLEAAGVEPFATHRAHIEAFARELEMGGRAPSTVARKLAALSGFYTYAAEEGLLDRSPMVGVRRPRVDDESPALGLDRDELRRVLAAARECGPRDTALALLLAMDGLRISEALGADVSDLGHERGHRTLRVRRKGNRQGVAPLVPLVAEAIDAYLDDRTEGPLFITSTGKRLDRHSASDVVAKWARRAGVEKRVTPHSFRHSFVTLALDAGAQLRDVQDAAGHRSPNTTRRYDRGRGALERHPAHRLAEHIA